MKSKTNLRAVAATILYQVIEQGQSLSAILPSQQKALSDKDKALTAEICYGVLRTLPEQEFIIQQLMDKVLTGKNRVLHFLLMVGIYQLTQTRVPAHAAIAESVNAVTALNKTTFKGLVNGVLRQFQRQQSTLLAEFNQKGNTLLHPSWLVKQLQDAYPATWSTIITANNQKPPMWLRVNCAFHTGESYLALLMQQGIDAVISDQLPYAIRLLQPVPVSQLPGFTDAWVTVQDVSAQYAAQLLEPRNGDEILDLCAAPGGKTTHILELAPQANVTAVDIEPQRLNRVTENLARHQQTATVKVGDGRYPSQWLTNQTFDRILLDAPCSATGVIRRHPDIKWLRRASDIEELANVQHAILSAIWPYLKPGGRLVYATCSVLPQENRQQIQQFLAQTDDAQLLSNLRQFEPTPDGGDGFFYAVLQKEN